MNKISIKSFFFGVVAIIALFAGSTQVLAQGPGSTFIPIEPAELPDRINKQLIKTKTGDFVFINVAGYPIKKATCAGAGETDVDGLCFGPTGAPVPESPNNPAVKSAPNEWPLKFTCPTTISEVTNVALAGRQCFMFYYAFFLFKADGNGDATGLPLDVLEAQINIIAARHLVDVSSNGRLVNKDAPILENNEVEFSQASRQGPIFGAVITDESELALTTAKAEGTKKLKGFVGTQGPGTTVVFRTANPPNCVNLGPVFDDDGIQLVRDGIPVELSVFITKNADGTETNLWCPLKDCEGTCSSPDLIADSRFVGCIGQDGIAECLSTIRINPYWATKEKEGKIECKCYDFALGFPFTCITGTVIPSECGGGTLP